MFELLETWVGGLFIFFLMRRRPPRSTQGRSSAASDVYKRQVLALPPGTGVSITRSDVEYIITEFGIAYIYGKSIRERCLSLIDIAHPDFRDELMEQARACLLYTSPSPRDS